MRKFGTFTAVAAMFSAGATHAQNASDAFECDLPYRDTMMAMGSLEVISQTPVKPFPGLHGDGELIEFAPGASTVFDIKPQMLSVEFLQPHSMQARQHYTVTFSASFARSTATDEAIQRSVDWHIGCGALEFCIRSAAARPEGGGRFEYRRKADLELQCIFEFTPKEFEAIGN